MIAIARPSAVPLRMRLWDMTHSAQRTSWSRVTVLSMHIFNVYLQRTPRTK